MRHKRWIALLALVLASPLAGSAHAARTVTITGGGWGHGIGMSQYGAYGRARNGKSAEEILEYYYSGAEVITKKMPKIRVGLLQGRQQIEMTSSPYQGGTGDLVWKVKGEKARLAEGAAGAKWRVEPSSTGGMRLYKNGTQIKRDGNGVFGSTATPLIAIYERHGSLIDVTDKTYDFALGRAEVGSYASDGCDPGFCLRLALSLSMQKYLYGLAEVPSSWPASALRTQAIAGRTYAYEKSTRSGNHRYPCDCTVYDSTIDQAYAGDGKRTGSGEYWDDWQAAVNDTKDQIATYAGAPIQALYSSSSGGHTENNENVWGGTPLPYLRGVPDKPDAVDVNPNHKWDPVTMSFSEFESKLQAAYGIGQLQRFNIVRPRGVSGRVTVVKEGGGGGVRIVGSNKTVRTSGWDFRSKFGSSILLDTLFYISIEEEVAERMVPMYRKLDGAPGDALAPAYPVPKRADRKLGVAQDFQRGRMTWVRATDEVVWQWGSVLERYDRLGRESSKLGMPTSHVWGEDGRYHGATYVNGVILFSKDTGAHHIKGRFFDAFSDAGGRKRLGLPLTDVRKTRRDLRQRLTRGTLYRRLSGGRVIALWGAIDERYRAMGGPSSNCGFPTSSMVRDRSGAAASFENGSIVWTEDGGVKVNCN